MKTFTLFIFAFFALCVKAEGNRTLFIHLKTGDVVAVQFDNAVKTTFADGIVSVGNEQYQFANISKFTYGNGSDGIAEVKGDGIKMGDHHIKVKTDKAVRLFSVDGKELAVSVKRANGVSDISVDGLPVGVYLLQIGTETIKFTKR